MKNLLFLFLVLPLFSFAQGSIEMLGAQTVWSDSFMEWTLFYVVDGEEEEDEGKLELRWISQRDWTEWDFELGEEHGDIVQASRYQPHHWELRVDGAVLTIRPRWNNDFSEWKITDNQTTIVYKSKWRNTFNQWSSSRFAKGNFTMKTNWDDDPRQWEIYDELDLDVPNSFKMAMLFITTFYSSPKL